MRRCGYRAEGRNGRHIHTVRGVPAISQPEFPQPEIPVAMSARSAIEDKQWVAEDPAELRFDLLLQFDCFNLVPGPRLRRAGSTPDPESCLLGAQASTLIIFVPLGMTSTYSIQVLSG